MSKKLNSILNIIEATHFRTERVLYILVFYNANTKKIMLHYDLAFMCRVTFFKSKYKTLLFIQNIIIGPCTIVLYKFLPHCSPSTPLSPSSSSLFLTFISTQPLNNFTQSHLFMRIKHIKSSFKASSLTQNFQFYCL